MNLDPTDYWKLRTVSAELERDQVALNAIQNRLEIARQKRHVLWMELTAKYQLDANANYSARDEDCSLVLSPNGNQVQQS